MDAIKTMSQNMSDNAEDIINPALDNPYVMAILKISLALYATQLAPRLPESVTVLFDNTFVKIMAVATIAYISERDFQLAIMLALVYVMGINALSGRGLLESFANYSKEYKTDGKFKLIEPKTVVYPGCLNVTKDDLLKAFDGDNIKLQTSLQYAYYDLLHQAKTTSAKEALMKMAYATGLPYNVEFNDENAPYIATMLMYRGFELGTSCAAPQ